VSHTAGIVYGPPAFVETRPEVIAGAIAAARIGDLVTVGPGGLDATPLPLLFEAGGEHGALVGHLARANPQWREFDAAREALVIFRSADAYVSPSMYPSKAEHGKVVPTWNYCTIHAYGPLVVHNDLPWVEALVRRLTQRHEASRPTPWAVEDAPAAFVAHMLRAIVGIEVPITRLHAKWKLSQNRSQADIDGVCRDLASGTPGDRKLASAMREASREPPG